MQWIDQIRKVKILLVLTAIIIAVASLLVSHFMVRDLSLEERNKMEVWAQALHALNHADENTDLSLVLSVIQENNTIPVIVNWKDSMNLVAQLRENGLTYRLMTRLLQYSVNVRRNDYLKLKQIGAIEEVLEDMFMISDSAFYDNEVGLITTNHWLEETLIL